jgi:dephospho-CoA kinase
MLKVGLTGGYATGKSFVAETLVRLGCKLIYADELGHRVLLPDGEAHAPTVQAFGRDILTADGSIDRKKLGALVFASPELLEKLSSFVHPAVFRLEKQMLEAFAARDPHGIAVIEAAILIETGRYKVFDRLILTACDVNTQIARGIKRDHLTQEQVLARLARQMPLEEKKKYAHYIIDTSGSKEETVRQIETIHSELKQLAEGRHP